MDFVSGNIDSAFQDDSLSTIVLVPPPGLSSLEIETAVVADCLDPDLEVVWQIASFTALPSWMTQNII